MKNRRENSGNCVGTNLNYNYHTDWKTGNDPCSDNYPGSAAGSEPETQLIEDSGFRFLGDYSYHEIFLT